MQFYIQLFIRLCHISYYLLALPGNLLGGRPFPLGFGGNAKSISSRLAGFASSNRKAPVILPHF